MPKAIKDYDVQDIAKRLITKNTTLGQVVENNVGNSYKALEQHITGRLCASIGRSTGKYVQRNKLIWAIINEVEGTTASGDLDF